MAELVPGVGLRDRPGAVGQGVAGEDGGASGPSSASASSPSSVASGRLKTTSRGSRTAVGVAGAWKSGGSSA